MSHHQSLSEGALELGVAISNKTTAAGAVTGLVGWAAQINWLGLSGVLIGAAGLAANVYFQYRRDKREAAESVARDKREAEESAARIASLREQCELP